MNRQESENQLKLFDINPISSKINTLNNPNAKIETSMELFPVWQKLKDTTRWCSKAADKNLVLRIENDKLKQELRLLKKAN